MFRAVLWKEVREQGAILLTLVVLGAGILVAAVQLGGDPQASFQSNRLTAADTGPLALFLLAATAGVVVGGALFAGERETGTFGFLESLPVSRWRMWRAKILAGAALAAAAAALFLAVAVPLGLLGGGRRAPLVGLAVVLTVFVAFGWGAFGSSFARTTLEACGLGVLAGLLSVPVWVVLATLLEVLLQGVVRGVRRDIWVTIGSGYLMAVAPVLLSGLVFSNPDRQRSEVEYGPGAAKATYRQVRTVKRGWFRFGLRALLWLVVRQGLAPTLWLGLAAVIFGFIMLVPVIPMLALWPGLSLLAGVLAGVLGSSYEQQTGANRFWGEGRYPVGRLWLAKVLFGLAQTALWCLLLALPSVIRAAAEEERTDLMTVFRSGILAGDRFPGGTFLWLWPAYGFAFGHLAGLLFKKPIVSAGVAALIAGPLAGLWFPSLLTGGLHGWQVWLPPVVALVTARLVMRWWAADNIGTRRPLARLAAGGVAVLVLAAAGLGWRVLEVERVPEADDDVRFTETIPGFEQNEAGRAIRTGISQLNTHWPTVSRVAADRPLFKSYYREGSADRSFSGQVFEVLKHGWPADRSDLDAWMDRVFAVRWDEPLRQAAGKPLGVVDDPTTMTVVSLMKDINLYRTAPLLLLARGLQAQARGEPGQYVRDLDAALAFARNLRHKAVVLQFIVAVAVEQYTLASLDRWLERLDGRPDLLRAMLAVLARHEATVPTSYRDHTLAERTVVRRTLQYPSQWAGEHFKQTLAQLQGIWGPDLVQERADMEDSLLGFAFAVPWERERLMRIVGRTNQRQLSRDELDWVRGMAGMAGEVVGWGLTNDFDAAGRDRKPTADRRAAVLKVALQLHRAEAGRTPRSLGELVPKYLPAVPADPYDGKPFRYRVSAGEKVEMDAVPSPEPPGPPPAFLNPTSDADLREKHTVFGAVSSGVTAWPLPPLPAPGTDQSPEVMDAVAAVVGTGVFGPLDPDAADANAAPGTAALPGVFPDEILPETFDAVAAAVGGVVQWPQFLNTPGGLGMGGPGGFGPPIDREVVDVPAGQMVVWSVGPDGFDGGGTTLALNFANGSAGDLIYLVPLTPAERATIDQREREKAETLPKPEEKP